MNTLNEQELQSIKDLEQFLENENSIQVPEALSEYQNHFHSGLHRFAVLDVHWDDQGLIRAFSCELCDLFPWQVSHLGDQWLKNLDFMPEDERSFVCASEVLSNQLAALQHLSAATHSWAHAEDPNKGGVCEICKCHADSVTHLGNIDVMLLPGSEYGFDSLTQRYGYSDDMGDDSNY